MTPADQRLHPRDAVRHDVQLGLVIKHELFAFERHAQVGFDGPAALDGFVHRRDEEAIGAARLGLGVEQRQIGVAEDFLGVVGIVGKDRQPDRRRAMQCVAADYDRRRDDPHDLLGHRGDAVGVRRIDLYNGEFVGAQSRDGVGLAHAILDPPSHRLQQLVADRMAERVVDFLEVVEVDQMDRRQLPGAARLTQHLFQAVAEQRAVGEPRQRVVARHVLRAFLGRLAVGDVVTVDVDVSVLDDRLEQQREHAVAATQFERHGVARVNHVDDGFAPRRRQPPADVDAPEIHQLPGGAVAIKNRGVERHANHRAGAFLGDARQAGDILRFPFPPVGRVAPVTPVAVRQNDQPAARAGRDPSGGRGQRHDDERDRRRPFDEGEEGHVDRGDVEPRDHRPPSADPFRRPHGLVAIVAEQKPGARDRTGTEYQIARYFFAEFAQNGARAVDDPPADDQLRRGDFLRQARR